MTIEQQNIEAAQWQQITTPNEIRYLLGNCKRSVTSLDRAVWDESIRLAYLQMRLEKA